MPTSRETILAALRGDVLPERIPAEGLLILRETVSRASRRSRCHPCTITTSTALRSRRWCKVPTVTRHLTR